MFYNQIQKHKCEQRRAIWWLSLSLKSRPPRPKRVQKGSSPESKWQHWDLFRLETRLEYYSPVWWPPNLNLQTSMVSWTSALRPAVFTEVLSVIASNLCGHRAAVHIKNFRSAYFDAKTDTRLCTSVNCVSVQIPGKVNWSLLDVCTLCIVFWLMAELDSTHVGSACLCVRGAPGIWPGIIITIFASW